MRRCFCLAVTIFLAGAANAFCADPNVDDAGAFDGRVYSKRTNNYDPKTVLGRFYILDKAKNTIEDAIEAPTVSLKCKIADVLAKAAIQMEPQEAYYFLADQKFSGSLALFTFSAKLTSEQRQQIELTDVARAAIQAECQLTQAQVLAHAKSLQGSKGNTVIWVYEALQSNLTNETYDHTEAQAGGSAGSWLSVGTQFYKGNTKRGSLPLISVSGLQVDVPKDGHPQAMSVRSFNSLTTLGLSTKAAVFLP